MARGCEVLVLVCLAGVLALSCGNSSSQEVRDAVKVARKSCLGRSTKQCVYLNFFSLLDQVLPSIGFQGFFRWNTSEPVLRNNVFNSQNRQAGLSVQMVNHLLADRLYSLLSAASVRGAKSLGNSTFQTIRRVMDLEPAVNHDKQVQRGRRFYWWRYLSILLLTLALTLFSALISKALTLATISLLLSLLGLLGGLGGLGGSGGGGHGYNYPYSPPHPAYRSPTTLIAPARYPGLQYEEEQEDPANPYVYVNRKQWKSTARSGLYKYHYEE